MDPLLKHEGEEFYSVKVNAVGSSAIYTISSSYDSNYPSGLLNLIEPREYERIIDRVNDEILGHWPCGMGYIFIALIYAPISLLLTSLSNNENICGGCLVMEAEKVVRDLLYQYSLKACYYDNNITIELKKTLFSSWIEFRFPVEYVRRQCGTVDNFRYSASEICNNDIESNIKPRVNSAHHDNKVK